LVEYARSQNPALHLELFPNYSDIVAAAKRGEIDCFLMDDLPANYYLVKHGLLEEFSRLPLPVLNHIYLATWEGNTEVLALLREGLSKFSKEEIDNLLKPYVATLATYPPWLGRFALLSLLGGGAFLAILLAFNRLLKQRVVQATEELRAKTRALEEAEQKILKTVETVAALPLLSVSEAEFLSQMLDLALELIPKARAGGALLVEQNGKGRIVAVRGHSKDLVGFTFEKEDLVVVDEVRVVRGLLDPKRRFSSLERLERLITLSLPVAETLVAPLFWGERLFGHLTLDILEGDGERFDEGDLSLAERFARICVAFHALREYVQKEELLLERLLFALAQALEYYDGSTRVHSEVSAGYALEIARSLGLPEEKARLVRWAALVHDVGKIFIPQSILRKPGKLTDEEYELVKLHAVKGEDLLAGIKDLEPVARIVRHHHERFDGTGYPDGLRGEEIPLESRILAVVDAFEAMTSDRPYRRAMGIDEALEELKRSSGTQFDPRVVQAMVALIEEQVEYTREKE
ncbi:MAG: HD domain-containing protein, partial [Candidatus Caldatribacterium sp.]|nr:HD domain-containing protein [Candidatus Caldatribacterium sp.]